MAKLSTKYMGLELKNPIIAGASNMVTEPGNIKRMENAGAAAIVYKSLFEEQVQIENLELDERKTEYNERNAEMITLFPDVHPENSDIPDHLKALENAKSSVSIPVIASINAIRDETWIDYATKIEKTGVDGLELNLSFSSIDIGKKDKEIEKRQIELVKKVKAAVKIPVSVKINPHYTDLLKHIMDLVNAGADGIVLFNKMFQPDIDIYSEDYNYPYSLSNSEDNRLPLRYAGLVYGKTKSSLCASTGIMTGYDVIKMILAGSDAVQVVSTLYLNQIGYIETMINDIEKWMESKGYNSLTEFKGKLSEIKSGNKLPFMKTQYSDIMMTTSQILKKYKILT